MPLSLLSQLFPKDNIFYYIIYSRLRDYIDIRENKLLELSFSRIDNLLIEDKFKEIIKYSLHELVANELFVDLCIRYKQDDEYFTGRKEIFNIISLVYIKYAKFARHEIARFYRNLSKLQAKLKREKWSVTKSKKISSLIEPIKITLDTRFGIIKRANGNCEGCGSSIFLNPIEVYQIRDNDKIKFKAYCNICRKKNEDIIENEY